MPLSICRLTKLFVSHPLAVIGQLGTRMAVASLSAGAASTGWLTMGECLIEAKRQQPSWREVSSRRMVEP